MKNQDPAFVPMRPRWRRDLLALACCMALVGATQAQTIDLYSFSSGTGAALDPMTGATTLIGTGTDWDSPQDIAIGFPFTYESTAYSVLSVNTHGNVRMGLGTVGGGQIWNIPNNGPEQFPNLLVWSQEAHTGGDGGVSTVLVGDAPDRIRIVQWKVRLPNNWTYTDLTNSTYQLWLYEGSNKIEFRYGTMNASGGGDRRAAIVGAAPGHKYINVLDGNTGSTTSTAVRSTWPSAGQVYTFTPPAPCSAPDPGNTMASVTSGCPGMTTALSLSASTSGSGVSYQWQSSPDGSTWSNIGGATNATYTSGALGATTWFQCQVTCVTGPATAASTPVEIVVSEPAMSYYMYTGVQVNENFNAWTNRCSTGDVPNGTTSGYWRNFPASGPGSWRASTTTAPLSGWDNTSGQFTTTSLGASPSPNALPITYTTARFHSRQGGSVVGTLDFYVDMSAATGTEKLRFEYINSAGSGNLGVWVSTNGGSDFTQVGSTLTATTPINTWVMREFIIGSTSATTVIRLRGTAAPGASGNDIGVDNFRIIPAATCATPTAPTASVTGPGTVDIGWTCAGCTGNFYVEYKAGSFTPGTGASAGGGTMAGPFTSSPATITGLPAGGYTAYMRQDCGGGNGFSENVGPFTFGIANGDFCANAIDMTTLPLTDWSMLATTANATNSFGTSPCFTGMSNADVILYRDVAAGATLAFTLETYSARATVAYGSACPGSTSLGCTPTGGGQLSLGTYVQQVGWDNVLSWTNNGCNTERVYILLSANSASAGEAYIANYAYTPAAGPFCPAVAGLTVNTANTGTNAQVNWDNTCSGNVIVEYGPAGFTPGTGATAGSGTVVSVSGTSTVLNSLDLDTPYEVYVRQDCGGGTFGANGTAASFTLHSGDDCSRVLPLTGESGSLIINTTGANDDISVCGSGNTGGDLVLSYVVQPGYGIYFASTPSTPFSGHVRIAYGNTCPGANEVYCQAGAVDQFWLNGTGDVQTVYFIQDGADEGSTTIEWSYFPECALQDTDGDGINDCDDSCPELAGGVGDPCTISGMPGTIDAGCTCVAAPCAGNQVVVTIHTDANGGQTTWQIQDAFAFTLASGGPYSGQDNTTVSETACLPTTFGNCYSFFLFDSFGDGLCCANGNGYWELNTPGGATLLRDRFEASTNGSQSPSTTPLSAGYLLGHEFCLPEGPSNILPEGCGVFSNTLQSKVYTRAIPGVASYQFEFSDPDAGFRRRIAVPRNWVKFSEMQTSPLVPGVTYFARARADQGASGFEDDHFGTGCEMGVDPASIGCTSLIDDPIQPTHSCGAVKHFGGSDKIWARPLLGATQYRFRFTNAGEGFVRQIDRPSYVCLLSWVTTPLQPGVTYDVTVNALVSGAWTGFCGPTCQVTIIGNGGRPETRMVEASMGTADVHLWPNPNTGERMNIQADGFDDLVSTVAIDVLDLSGKVVRTRTLPVMHGQLNTVLDLGPLDNGTYLMRFTTHDQVLVERFVVQH